MQSTHVLHITQLCYDVPAANWKLTLFVSPVGLVWFFTSKYFSYSLPLQRFFIYRILYGISTFVFREFGYLFTTLRFSWASLYSYTLCFRPKLVEYAYILYIEYTIFYPLGLVLHFITPCRHVRIWATGCRIVNIASKYKILWEPIMVHIRIDAAQRYTSLWIL